MPLIDPNCHGIEWRMLWKSSFQFLFSEKGNILNVGTYLQTHTVFFKSANNNNKSSPWWYSKEISKYIGEEVRGAVCSK